MANQVIHNARESLQLLMDLCLLQEGDTLELPRKVDWPSLVSTAHFHGLLPLLYHKLKGTRFWGQCPEETRTNLLYAFAKNLQRTEVQRRELVKITRALTEASIPVIPYKGCFLSQLLYGDPYVRVSSDIDIIIPREDTKKAWDILTREMGYQGLSPARGFVDVSKTNEYHYVVVKRPAKKHGAFHQVEVHWELLRNYAPFSPPMERIWAASKPVSMWEATFQKPEDEVHFLMLVVHSLCDSWPLKSLVDLAIFYSSLSAKSRDTVSEEAFLWGIRPLLKKALSKIEDLKTSPSSLGKEHTTRRQHGFHVLRNTADITSTKKDKLRYFVQVLTKPSFRDYDLIPGKRKSRTLATLVRPYRLLKEWFLK